MAVLAKKALADPITISPVGEARLMGTVSPGRTDFEQNFGRRHKRPRPRLHCTDCGTIGETPGRDYPVSAHQSRVPSVAGCWSANLVVGIRVGNQWRDLAAPTVSTSTGYPPNRLGAFGVPIVATPDRDGVADEPSQHPDRHDDEDPFKPVDGCSYCWRTASRNFLVLSC
jgi:hypothetical protein